MSIKNNKKDDHAWRYFELHANQRISLFRYYVLLLSLYVTSVGYYLHKFCDTSNIEELGVIIFSFAFIVITTIFWYVDKRNRMLIHIAEGSLSLYERDSALKYKHKIFTRERRISHLTARHTQCFNWLFKVALFLAFIIILYSIIHLYFPQIDGAPRKTSQTHATPCNCDKYETFRFRPIDPSIQ